MIAVVCVPTGASRRGDAGSVESSGGAKYGPWPSAKLPWPFSAMHGPSLPFAAGSEVSKRQRVIAAEELRKGEIRVDVGRPRKYRGHENLPTREPRVAMECDRQSAVHAARVTKSGGRGRPERSSARVCNRFDQAGELRRVSPTSSSSTIRRTSRHSKSSRFSSVVNRFFAADSSTPRDLNRLAICS